MKKPWLTSAPATCHCHLKDPSSGTAWRSPVKPRLTSSVSDGHGLNHCCGVALHRGRQAQHPVPCLPLPLALVPTGPLVKALTLRPARHLVYPVSTGLARDGPTEPRLRNKSPTPPFQSFHPPVCQGQVPLPLGEPSEGRTAFAWGGSERPPSAGSSGLIYALQWSVLSCDWFLLAALLFLPGL